MKTAICREYRMPNKILCIASRGTSFAVLLFEMMCIDIYSLSTSWLSYYAAFIFLPMLHLTTLSVAKIT